MAERELYYLDFPEGQLKPFEAGDTIATALTQLPIGYVLSNTTNTDPTTDLGYGNWVYLGSQTIGSTTVYYYENTAA